MRTTSALKTAALLIAAVVLALGTVQGSLAVWNTATSTSAGTVQAADFAVTVGADPRTAPRLSTSGAPAVVKLPSITELTPKENTRTVKVPINNATDAGSGKFHIQIAVTEVKMVPVESGKPKLEVTAGISATGTCPTKPPVSLNLAQGTSATLCVTVTLNSDAPATSGGQTSSVSVELTATQL